MNAIVEVALPPEDDTFCLAVVEHSGNLAAAYRAAYGDHPFPIARARELIARPEIAKRIQYLSEAIDEASSISLGSHLVQLAKIRDLAIDGAQLKVALGAEKARGEAAGFYAKALKGPSEGDVNRPAVAVFIGTTPANANEWGQKYGHAPVVVEAVTKK